MGRYLDTNQGTPVHALTARAMHRAERQAASAAVHAHCEDPRGDGCDECQGWRTPCPFCGLGEHPACTTPEPPRRCDGTGSYRSVRGPVSSIVTCPGCPDCATHESMVRAASAFNHGLNGGAR
jgi:hypothetical protein